MYMAATIVLAAALAAPAGAAAPTCQRLNLRPVSGAWEALPTDGLESREFRLRAEDGSVAKLVAVRLDPAKFRIRLRWQLANGSEAARALDVARETGAAVVVNAGYFDENGRPLGYFKADGKVYNSKVLFRGRPNALHLGALFTVLDDGGRVTIATRESFVAERARGAFQAGPHLVSGGRPVRGLERYREYHRPARRTVAAFGRDGKLIFVVSEADDPGLSWCELQEFLVRPEAEGGLGVSEAMNLDGGSSSQLVIQSGSFQRYLSGRHVPAFIVAVPKAAVRP